MDALNFELTRKEQPVTIGGSAYTLVELDGAARDKYLQDLTGRVRTTPEGKPAGVKNFCGLQASLVSASLVDATRKPVPASLVQSWPARVVAALYDAARELSGLEDENDDEPEKEGND